MIFFLKTQKILSLGQICMYLLTKKISKLQITRHYGSVVSCIFQLKKFTWEKSICGSLFGSATIRKYKVSKPYNVKVQSDGIFCVGFQVNNFS